MADDYSDGSGEDEKSKAMKKVYADAIVEIKKEKCRKRSLSTDSDYSTPRKSNGFPSST